MLVCEELQSITLMTSELRLSQITPLGSRAKLKASSLSRRISGFDSACTYDLSSDSIDQGLAPGGGAGAPRETPGRNKSARLHGMGEELARDATSRSPSLWSSVECNSYVLACKVLQIVATKLVFR